MSPGLFLPPTPGESARESKDPRDSFSLASKRVHSSRLFHFRTHGEEENSMQSKKQFCKLISRIIARAATAALAIATVFALTVVLTQSAQPQTLKVLHSFTGGGDGASPGAGVTMDQAGNLFGTTASGGIDDNGTVFRLSKRGSGWVLNPLYLFLGGSDGATPYARVVFGPDGSLYGTTYDGGGDGCSGYGCGTVFNLKPPATACKTALCPWTETVLYRFTGGSDGGEPSYGDLVFDQAGNLYGTTYYGGDTNCDAPFRLWRRLRVDAVAWGLDGERSLRVYWRR